MAGLHEIGALVRRAVLETKELDWDLERQTEASYNLAIGWSQLGDG